MAISLLVGWMGAFIVLGGYAWSIRTSRPLVLHWANAIGAIGTAWSAIVTRAWPNLFLTACFGLLGAAGVWRDRQSG